MTKRRWAAWAAALSTTAVGCASLIGIDKDYFPAGEGGGSGTGGGVSSAGDTSSPSGGGISCKAGDKRCQGDTPESCDDKGQWQSGAACALDKQQCVAGACATLPPSCVNLPRTCGLKGDESCCAVTEVPGGTYNRSNDPLAPATVSGFRLDRFEITVGRFRKFADAYPGNKPKAGDGAHPHVLSSGWDAAWDTQLPADRAALSTAIVMDCDRQTSPQCFTTWSDKAGMKETLPVNSITWFEAFAFCAWDGGRLPTEAEWNYAAAGGSEQRPYPWGSSPPDGAHAAYDCIEDGSTSQQCGASDILPVGSKPAGDGLFGQADLAGSVFEWNLDGYTNTFSSDCTDCACVGCECKDCLPKGGFFQVLRGGSFSSHATDLDSSHRSNANNNSNRLFGSPGHRLDYVGARCARDL